MLPDAVTTLFRTWTGLARDGERSFSFQRSAEDMAGAGITAVDGKIPAIALQGPFSAKAGDGIARSGAYVKSSGSRIVFRQFHHVAAAETGCAGKRELVIENECSISLNRAVVKGTCTINGYSCTRTERQRSPSPSSVRSPITAFLPTTREEAEPVPASTT